MLVRLKNDWFDGQSFHKKGIVIEWNGDKKELPSDAEVLSEKGTLPTSANTPKAGFGAKPVEEQLLDIAGAGPTHQIEVAGPSPTLTDEEREEQEKKDREVREKEAAEAKKKADEQTKEDGKQLEKVLPDLEKAAEEVKKANDPLAALDTKSAKK